MAHPISYNEWYGWRSVEEERSGKKRYMHTYARNTCYSDVDMIYTIYTHVYCIRENLATSSRMHQSANVLKQETVSICTRKRYTNVK